MDRYRLDMLLLIVMVGNVYLLVGGWDYDDKKAMSQRAYDENTQSTACGDVTKVQGWRAREIDRWPNGNSWSNRCVVPVTLHR